MFIECQEIDRNLIVRMRGEIDHHSAQDLKARTEREFARQNAKNIIFDFSQVGFMDSSGVGVLIGRYKALEPAGGKVCAAGVSGEMGRVFEVTGLKKIIPCFPGVDEAVKWAGERGRLA